MPADDGGAKIVRGLGLLCLLIGLATAWPTLSWIRRSVPARATLAGTEMKRDERKANSVFQYYPVLEFTDAQGRAHRFTGEVSLKERDGGATERSGWDVGDTVQIRYDPRNPDDARMGGVWTWILPGFFIGMAALLLFSAHRMAEY